MDGALHFLTFERAEIATYPSTSWPQARAAAILCSREFGRNGPAVRVPSVRGNNARLLEKTNSLRVLHKFDRLSG